MRRVLMLVATILFCASTWAQEPPNLVANPGFEQIEGGLPAAWELAGEVSLDNAQFYAGASGLRISHERAATSTARQVIAAGSREYLLLAWVRLTDVVGEGARIRIIGGDERLVAQTDPMIGTQGWRRVRLAFNPGDTNQVTVELSLRRATGAAWFDDVVVGPADEVQATLTEAEVGEKRENIARGRPYTLSPPPSYEYCTDAGDLTQLTDGEYTIGYFWTQLSTVGWYLHSPQIVVDLGQVRAIDGIMVNCPGGGRAGVMFPQSVTYLVSDDGEVFHQVAQLTPAGLRQDGTNWYTHKFLADDLNTRGRYVMIVLDKAGSTVFADELEIYPGDHDPATVTFASPPVSRTDMAFAQYGITPDSYRPGHFPESPHIRWAKPLAGGPVRAIMLCYSDDMRDVCEVAQRVDLDYEPVQHFSFYRDTPLGQLMQEQIERTLPQAEVMVVAGFRWAAMPAELLEKIRARVREGMGLVCVSVQPSWLDPIMDIFEESPLPGDQGILDAIAMEALPDYRPPREAHFHLGMYGQGRVARVRWGEFTRPEHSLLPNLQLADIDDDGLGAGEIAHAAFAKLLLWAAQREPGATPAGATIERVWRDRQFDEQARATADAAEGLLGAAQDRCRLNGRNTITSWLRDAAGAVVDFAVEAYDVQRDAAIESVEMLEEVFAHGSPVEARVNIAGEREGLTLRARLVDTYGRQLGPLQEIPVPAAGAVALSMPAPEALTLVADLHTELVRGAEVLEKRLDRAWIATPEDRDDLIFCAWYAWDFQPTAFWGLRMLEKMGVDTYVSLPGAWRAENASYSNVRHGPENVERVVPQNTDDSLVRVPCLTDPDYRAQVAERVTTRAAQVRRFGVEEWSLGDESTLGGRDYCTSPTCLAAFRRYLQERFDSVADLNASWGTEFATWDDVVPCTRAEIEGRENLGQWLDHRRYMERLFTDYHTWLRGLIEAQIPIARVGISGTPRPNSYSGHDWWQLMQEALTHLSGYGGVQRELQRSFMRPGTFYSTFLGYDYKDSDEQRARYGPWDLLLHGASGINYYTLVSNTLNCPLVRPDGSLTRHAQWFFPEVAELRRGIGRLLIAGDYVDDGIAIHYSPPSVHAATATGLFAPSNQLRNWQTNLTNVGRIIQQLHLQFDFIHEDQMRAGELSRYRVLILPWSSAISEAEAAAIREFVEAGGTVIADSYCGVRDDHGHARAMLDDLFGIRQPLDPPELAHATLSINADAGLGLERVPVASGCANLGSSRALRRAASTGRRR
ncbi:MAG: beta-galactosidase [Armatimonadota bacterium]